MKKFRVASSVIWGVGVAKANHPFAPLQSRTASRLPRPRCVLGDLGVGVAYNESPFKPSALPGVFLFSFVHASMTPSKRKTPASTELKKGLSLSFVR